MRILTGLLVSTEIIGQPVRITAGQLVKPVASTQSKETVVKALFLISSIS